jgi:hypothetical protein
MARLASTAAGGSCPSPPRVVEVVRRQLTAAPTGAKRVVRVLDPIAGTGEPAAALAGKLGGESYRVTGGIDCNWKHNLVATAGLSVRSQS